MLAGVLWASPLYAQAPEQDLKKEIEQLKQGQEAIQKELQELKKLIEARLAPRRPAGPNVKDVVLDIGDDPGKGENTAPLTLVEFTDYQ